jgi:CMP-2-keto-3-deoxyoctulosonic acid synthetase
MIEHVWRAALRCPLVDRWTIATGDVEIAEAASQFGATLHFDSGTYRNGTERCAGAAQGEDIVVVVQADQPGLNPAHLTRALEHLITTHADMVTVCTPLPEPCSSPHVVKCLSDQEGRAVDFSRAVLAMRPEQTHHKHLGIYAYRRGAIDRYAALEPDPRECDEDLEQLRALEAGFDIRIVEVADACPAIDRIEDVGPAERWISRSTR